MRRAGRTPAARSQLFKILCNPHVHPDLRPKGSLAEPRLPAAPLRQYGCEKRSERGCPAGYPSNRTEPLPLVPRGTAPPTPFLSTRLAPNSATYVSQITRDPEKYIAAAARQEGRPYALTVRPIGAAHTSTPCRNPPRDQLPFGIGQLFNLKRKLKQRLIPGMAP